MTTSIVSVDSTTSKIQVGGVDAIVFDATGITSGLGKNKLINGNFSINQRGVSGTVVLTAGAYGHDRWKAGASGCTYTFATVNNVTTITISAGSLQQVIEGLNLRSGAIVMGWTGTAQGKIGAGAYGATGVTGAAVGGTNLTVEFGTGTLADAQVETGSKTSAYEQRPYGMELALCQRYCWNLVPVAANAFVVGVNASTVTFYGVIKLPVTMRANPTLAIGGTNTFNYVGQTGGGVAAIALVGSTGPTDLAAISLTGASFTAGQAAYLTPTAGVTSILFNAEL